MAQVQQGGSQFGRVFKVVSGNFLEMFDFMVYGFYASAIAHAIFPNASGYISLMMSLMTFGVGFLMRPVGAIVLGAYIDRHGRRKGLIASLGIMSIGVLIIAFTPDYATIGMAAPILVLVGRLLQGFSAGAESGGVSVYLAEIAPPGKRGLYVAWQSASQQVAVIFAAILGVVLRFSLSEEQIMAWGWRIPFVIGSLIVPLLFYIRRTLQETEAFEKRAKTHAPTLREIYAGLLTNWKIVLNAVLLVTLTSVMFYLITAYTPTYGKEVLNLTARDAFAVTVCVGISNFIFVPLMGALSDKIGRVRTLTIFSIAVAVTAYPAMAWLVADPSFGRMLAVLLWLSFLYGGYQGVMVVSLTEMMPAHVRASGFSVAYSLAQAIFGGFTPAVSTWLIHSSGDKAMPGAWLAASAVASIIGVWMLHRSGAPVGKGNRAAASAETAATKHTVARVAH
ncbi:MFS transporter [Luteibacter aegosomaticola]|uniref:MFS transporter n=1 Tax=Luteibacter aegosomaticola TaxID=2911538 RepID=UPI001FF7E8FA|nr:MFS transporter [Luteibacter aegosomaticola]UPG89888.1 MFS transporter [Luteibacter aegosomaticola]